MLNWNTRNNTRKNKSLMRKMVITTCIGLGFTLTTVYAEETIGTVYHVYVDGDHIGKVDDKEVVQHVINQKVAEGEKEFKDLSLTVGEEIFYIPEKVFNPAFNNEVVSEKLNEELTVKANAVELKIADRSVGYFTDKESASNILETYISEYVDEDILEDAMLLEPDEENSDAEVLTFEAVSNPKEKEKLSTGDSMVTDVDLSDPVTFVNEKVSPKEIYNADQGLTILEKGTLEQKVHTVKKGEVLGRIAGKYDLSTEKLLELNPKLKEDSILKPGQDINTTEYEPFLDVIIHEEKKVKETVDYETEVIESEDMYKGEEKVKKEGKDGSKEVLYSIEKTNGKETGKTALDETITKEPVKEVIIKGTKVISRKGTGDMTWPAVGGYISSQLGERWGKTHKGIDIARPSSKDIRAADNGVVESAGYTNGGYGNKIVINHNNGMKTVYAHLDSIDVKVGQVVEKGSKIGVMGSTGNSTGTHLHFEVHKNGALKNPTDYVSK
ncbi:M23 family metallopeptidase [Oceanobacillus massiliensis]|uniref:M23 family metallopeptidase n=1 Tax=Oceanobacillus massiliensis TaxID=1465765 RepID=UPI0030176C9B